MEAPKPTESQPAESQPAESQPAASIQPPLADEVVDFKKGQHGKKVFLALLTLCVAGVVGFAALSESRRARARPPLRAGTNADDKAGGTGCPCGCDRSAAMAEELALDGAAASLGVIDETLAVIAEREEAGFVTDAMVSHRLRLLDLEATLAAESGLPALAAGDLRAPRFEAGGLPAASDGARRVRARLIVHGETTEVVGGREKLHRASYHLALELENLTETEAKVDVPEIRAARPFPISRWYVAGTGGLPWDGRISARKKTLAFVIGYLGSDCVPGTELDAAVHVGGLVLRVRTRARRHWTDAAPSL